MEKREAKGTGEREDKTEQSSQETEYKQQCTSWKLDSS